MSRRQMSPAMIGEIHDHETDSIALCPIEEIRSVTIEKRMRTLKQDGILKVLQGLTNIHQVRSVCLK